MEAQDERRWYVVQTYAGYENRVKANLEQRIATMGMEKNIFNVLVPLEERVFVKEGKSRKVSRKLYPSYVLRTRLDRPARRHRRVDHEYRSLGRRCVANSLPLSVIINLTCFFKGFSSLITVFATSSAFFPLGKAE